MKPLRMDYSARPVSTYTRLCNVMKIFVAFCTSSSLFNSDGLEQASWIVFLLLIDVLTPACHYYPLPFRNLTECAVTRRSVFHLPVETGKGLALYWLMRSLLINYLENGLDKYPNIYGNFIKRGHQKASLLYSA